MINEYDWQSLDDPFPASDIEWRIQTGGIKNGKPWARVLAYVTIRAIQQRLDDVVGKANWQDEYKLTPEGYLCGISIWVDGQWVTKWDGAERTDIEPFKGGLSGSEKRAAVKWGIGRYLYKLEAAILPNDRVTTEKNWSWNYAKTKDGAIYWTPPELPAWALPANKKQAEGKPPAPQKPRYGEMRKRLRKELHTEGATTAEEANVLVQLWSGGEHSNAEQAWMDEEIAAEILESLRQKREFEATEENFANTEGK